MYGSIPCFICSHTQITLASVEDDSRNYGEHELWLMLDSIKRLPNPLAEATADLTEAPPVWSRGLLPKQFQILRDRNPPKIPRMGTQSGIWHPSLFVPF